MLSGRSIDLKSASVFSDSLSNTHPPIQTTSSSWGANRPRMVQNCPGLQASSSCRRTSCSHTCGHFRFPGFLYGRIPLLCKVPGVGFAVLQGTVATGSTKGSCLVSYWKEWIAKVIRHRVIRVPHQKPKTKAIVKQVLLHIGIPFLLSFIKLHAWSHVPIAEPARQPSQPYSPGYKHFAPYRLSPSSSTTLQVFVPQKTTSSKKPNEFFLMYKLH